MSETGTVSVGNSSGAPARTVPCPGAMGGAVPGHENGWPGR